MKEKEIGHGWFNLEVAKMRSREGGDDLKGGGDLSLSLSLSALKWFECKIKVYSILHRRAKYFYDQGKCFSNFLNLQPKQIKPYICNQICNHIKINNIILEIFSL